MYDALTMNMKNAHAYLPCKCPNIFFSKVYSTLKLVLYQRLNVPAIRKLHQYVHTLARP